MAVKCENPRPAIPLDPNAKHFAYIIPNIKMWEAEKLEPLLTRMVEKSGIIISGYSVLRVLIDPLSEDYKTLKESGRVLILERISEDTQDPYPYLNENINAKTMSYILNCIENAPVARTHVEVQELSDIHEILCFSDDISKRLVELDDQVLHFIGDKVRSEKEKAMPLVWDDCDTKGVFLKPEVAKKFVIGRYTHLKFTDNNKLFKANVEPSKEIMDASLMSNVPLVSVGEEILVMLADIPKDKHSDFKAMAQGVVDFSVDVCHMDLGILYGDAMMLATSEGAAYITKEQAKAFFGLTEA